MRLCWVTGIHEDFLTLAHELDNHLRQVNGDRQVCYEAYNQMNAQIEVALLYDNDAPIACGALRLHGQDQAEVKRMYVRPAYRHRGLAKQLLATLEARAYEHGCDRLFLETSPLMLDAVALYHSYGFTEIPKYGPYCNLPSLCLGKPVQASKP